MPEVYDVAIIGAGPAGLAAAAAANARGARVVVVDSSAGVGGQFWRHGRFAAKAGRELTRFHSSRRQYRALRAVFDAALRAGSLHFLPSTSVWHVSHNDEFTLHLAPEPGSGASANSPAAQTVTACAVIVAAGAYDRQVPIPGWDLPGVMAAGGIQAFIKQHGKPPGKKFVIAGTGPFLLPVAVNVLQSGGGVRGVYESARLRRWIPHAHRAAALPGKLLEGGTYAATLAAHRVPYRQGRIVMEILGAGKVEAVRTARVDSRGHIVAGSHRVLEDVDGVGLGWGFTPQLELLTQLGAETTLGADGSLIAAAEAGGRSSVPGLYVAGEVTGVGGATLAVLEGEQAGFAAAEDNRAASSPAPPKRERRLRRNARFAEAMHTVHPLPEAWRTWVPDPCLVCRCEEVTAGEIRAAREALAATDQRSAKGLTRAGMGWCQGRVCGFAASSLAEGSCAEAGAPSVESLRAVNKRPIARPISLAQLAQVDDPGTQHADPGSAQ